MSTVASQPKPLHPSCWVTAVETPAVPVSSQRCRMIHDHFSWPFRGEYCRGAFVSRRLDMKGGEALDRIHEVNMTFSFSEGLVRLLTPWYAFQPLLHLPEARAHMG